VERCGYSPNRKVLLAVVAGQFILFTRRVIRYLKRIEIGCVPPDKNDVLLYSYVR
jgi:hypothetical protein